MNINRIEEVLTDSNVEYHKVFDESGFTYIRIPRSPKVLVDLNKVCRQYGLLNNGIRSGGVGDTLEIQVGLDVDNRIEE